jgi:ADP-ribose pyrophosphatase YjhB (NUDIX family)
MSHAYKCKRGCCDIEVVESPEYLYKSLRRGQCRKAGVFIYDPNEKRVLLVQSRGQLWGSPKGTLEIDIGEKSHECAVREVKEETGLEIQTKDFKRAVKIKNRAMYYYVEIPSSPVKVQTETKDNDANGITWIRLECLQECIVSGHIILNQHTRVLFRKFLGEIYPATDFVKIRRGRVD